MITSFLVIIFFPWVIIFFSPKATKKITHPRKKKLLTKKRSYSSNGNTFMPMIWRFYAPPLLFLCINRGKPYLLRINCTNIGYLLYSSSIFSLLSLSSKVCCESLYIWDTYKTTNKLAKTIYWINRKLTSFKKHTRLL